MSRPASVVATAPGRVNLIGDHTDTTGGWVLPLAVDLGTTVSGERGGDVVRLTSASEREPAIVPLDVDDPAAVEPPWARYVAGVVAEMRPADGLVGEIHTTLPIGAGLSSSAALELSVALALGFDGSSLDLAALCRRAEHRASGVPCGIMDQLASAAGVPGHALLIDCSALTVRPVPIPDTVAIVVVHSGEARSLVDSAYAERSAQCAAAEAFVGPLRDASLGAVDAIEDPVVRRRARHVVTENTRVLDAADALERGDAETMGRLMIESHASLRDDFDVSTPTLDGLVDRLVATPGVYGARLTGAGFGGCVVALTEPGTLDEGWTVHASGGAHLLADG